MLNKMIPDYKIKKLNISLNSNKGIKAFSNFGIELSYHPKAQLATSYHLDMQSDTGIKFLIWIWR